MERFLSIFPQLSLCSKDYAQRDLECGRRVRVIFVAWSSIFFEGQNYFVFLNSARGRYADCLSVTPFTTLFSKSGIGVPIFISIELHGITWSLEELMLDTRTGDILQYVLGIRTVEFLTKQNRKVCINKQFISPVGRNYELLANNKPFGS